MGHPSEHIYLGDWCLPDQKNKPIILPSPWSNPDKYIQATTYTDALIDEVYKNIYIYLKTHLQIHLCERAFAIILYPWLQLFIQILYDRYHSLLLALDAHADLAIPLPKLNSLVPPENTRHFIYLAQTDGYNSQIFSEIITHLGLNQKSIYIKKSNRIRNWLAETLKHSKDLTENLNQKFKKKSKVNFYSKNDKVLFYRIDHRHKTHINSLCDHLPIPSKQLPSNMFKYSLPKHKPTYNELRQNLSKNVPSNNSFEIFLSKILPNCFPTLYLEGLSKNINLTNNYLYSPQLLISNNHAWLGEDAFKFFAAKCIYKGTKFATVQINGNYFTYQSMPHLSVERKIAHSFFTWGEKGQLEPSFINLPCLYTNDYFKKTSSLGENILFMGAGISRYMKGFWSSPLRGGESEDYFQWQLRFFSTLKQPHKKNTIFRLRAHNQDPRRFRQRIEVAEPTIQIEDLGSMSAAERIQKPDIGLIVIDHCSTPWLEAFTANKPTLLYWNPQKWLFNKSSQKFINQLKSLDILHDSPEKAAKMVETVWEHRDQWWNDPKRQKIRQEILESYFRHSPTWLDEWTEAILKACP